MTRAAGARDRKVSQGPAIDRVVRRGAVPGETPLSYFSSYRYSTNDITAPSKPCRFGFVDSMT